MDKYNVDYIAEQCGVKKGSIVSYLKYCALSGIEVPQPIPYQSSKYVYTKQDADKIAEMFKNKKRGEMAEYNYKYCYYCKSNYPRHRNVCLEYFIHSS